ncbi:MAG: hypothetical protein ACJAZX_000572 [Rickettsiales bacterium]|jgi:hypothetical protein
MGNFYSNVAKPHIAIDFNVNFKYNIIEKDSGGKKVTTEMSEQENSTADFKGRGQFQDVIAEPGNSLVIFGGRLTRRNMIAYLSETFAVLGGRT